MQADCETSNATLFRASCASRLLNISRQQPEEYAVPLYGYATPIIVAFTVITNSFIVIVLSQVHLRTPTNFVLLSMAVTELLTGLTSLPWLCYYYTFQGYLFDKYYGLPEFWCRYHIYFSHHLPTVCHTSAIWLTVYLAIQRYTYICVRQKMVPGWCRLGPTRLCCIGICLAAALTMVPPTLAKYSVTFRPKASVLDELHYPGSLERVCVHLDADWVSGHQNLFYGVYFWFQAIAVHVLPCLLLLIFSAALIRTITRADRRRRRSFPNVTRKCSKKGRPAASSLVRSQYL